MKKYKLVNFLEKPTTEIRFYNIHKLLSIFIISLIVIKLVMYTSPIKYLESYSVKNKVYVDKETTKEYDNLNFTQIKAIYSIIGYDNVDELVAMENNIEVKGKCKDINELEGIKNIDIIKDYSIENIVKENDYYNFKLICKIR